MRLKLVQAKADGDLVCLERADIEEGHALGYILDIGPQFFLLKFVAEDIAFNGFQAMRIEDVTKLEVPHTYADFVERALELRREVAPPQPQIDLSSPSTLIESASRSFPVITIHREKADPDVCHIGRVIEVTSARVRLREITASAEWEDEIFDYGTSEVTRVDFGGRYEEALVLVGGSGLT